MVHILRKYKCEDTDGEIHIVLDVAYWDTGLNTNIRKSFIEIYDGDTTMYMTPGELSIKLDLEKIYAVL